MHVTNVPLSGRTCISEQNITRKKAARKKLFYAQQFQFISAVNVKTSIEKKKKIFRNHFSDISEDKLDT